MKKEVRFSAHLPVKIIKRKKWFLASCPILDVHAQGDTEKQAKKNLVEALTLFFVSCFERGTLDAVMKECGFTPAYPPTQYKKKPVVSKGDYIDVPIPFFVDSTKLGQCHA
ncbi:MAG: hypothetical protein ABIF87_01950 [Pseudomonadota bacterium]